MEQLYAKLINHVFNLSRTAPYRGVLKATGNWTCREGINKKIIMFYYYIWNSDEERLAKRIITKQSEKKYQNCWYTEL